MNFFLCLIIVKIMMETWNLVRQFKIILILLKSAFSGKNDTFNYRTLPSIFNVNIITGSGVLKISVEIRKLKLLSFEFRPISGY